ncbi:hypothetical protein NEPAR06_0178 [Nematocida parisii]|uniref:Uncharacterized protein n=1 Tax=Nematocida parisii (strain ERTm3) TaxID=935791 RepID=I3EDF7_NEMP3|nr:uncharacterized protein NEPG_00572 [Nematocida parisii ERTm1]EIJ87254.1 hypothetical protein NEQG_02589 [Nematocida parisii ERTm3]KAI5126635.1 hypothetical protein NEPAR08_0554 [Nematocida parisii]EIJ95047.1 hypothetical protein NEPG_00572 [Nematocida parisii ERTm1]KAI5127918.1 hypothetical protein NEPAR03_1198 [Nematocida parisii]KAI5142856.1 hypothetical protein NEPAR04_1676 [Nematocida parisii]|eukprot:XP_013058403.1 hypothetical protein NEPG_00572 [Nematocida parisii ERTm1]
MGILSEYLFAIDQWKLLEQWKIHILYTLFLTAEAKTSIQKSMPYRSLYDMHINRYPIKTYEALSRYSGQMKYEIMEYAVLEERMHQHLTRLRVKLLFQLRHDMCRVKFFIFNNVEVQKIAKPALSKYYMHILELIFIEEFSPAHLHHSAGKLYVHLKKSLSIGIDIRSTLNRITEIVVMATPQRAITAQQEVLLKGIFCATIRQVLVY